MFRSFRVFKNATVCSVVLGVAALSSHASFLPRNLEKSHRRIAFADITTDSKDKHKVTEFPVQDEKESMTEDEKWALKGEQCPLCKMALASPCIEEFKVFDTCLEKLKAKYGDEKHPDEEGMECFSGFHACMFANLEFFKAYVEEQEAQQAEAGGEDNVSSDSEDSGDQGAAEEDSSEEALMGQDEKKQ